MNGPFARLSRENAELRREIEEKNRIIARLMTALGVRPGQTRYIRGVGYMTAPRR